MRSYTTRSFVETIANKTRTPVMAIMTQGGCAGSQRYRDIAVDEDTQAELQDTDQAFLTFESVAEANAKFDEIVAQFPQPSDTTLGIEVLLALPGMGTRQLQQFHGDADGRVVNEPQPLPLDA